MRIGIVAGEPSGDVLGADLIGELRRRHPQAEIYGIGGPRMLAAGCRSLFPMEKLAVMGLTEVLPHLWEILGIRKALLRHFIANPPDVFIGVDAPSFNTGLELQLRRRGIKTVHYVSPSVWAWRSYRVKKIAQAVDHMLTLFPFEAQFYAQQGMQVTFVGHPLANAIALEDQQAQARRSLQLAADAQVVAILPGSRFSEINYLLPDFLRTARHCRNEIPQLVFLVAAAHAGASQRISELAAQYAPDLTLRVLVDHTHEVMAAADIVLLASGTATLEAMLLKRPMVVAYRVSRLTAWIARRLLHIDRFALPNLLAGEMLVPEFIQDQIDPRPMAEKVLYFLHSDAERQRLRSRFSAIHQQLRCDASSKAADAVLALAAAR